MRNYLQTAFLVVFIFLMGIMACDKPDDDPQPQPGNVLKPSIISFYPQTATGDEPVRIVGSNFNTATQVSFGGTQASKFTIVSDTLLFAYTGTGASGDVVVTNTSGTIAKSGFTYYTPQTFQVSGTAQWATLSAFPAMDSSGYRFVTGTESASITIRKINKYDTARIWTNYPHPVYNYGDSSASYVLLSRVSEEQKLVTTGITIGSYKMDGAGAYNLFAKIIDTLIVIPAQMPKFGLTIQGTGSIKNNKLVLKYNIDYRGNSKNATLSSQ